MDRKDALEILGLNEQAARHDIAIAAIRNGVYLSAEERGKLSEARKALEEGLPPTPAETPLAQASAALLKNVQASDANRKAALRAAVGAYFAREAAVAELESNLRARAEKDS
jgi:hypothetical protein